MGEKIGEGGKIFQAILNNKKNQCNVQIVFGMSPD